MQTTLTKTRVIQNASQRDAMLALYDGHIRGSVWTADGQEHRLGDPNYLTEPTGLRLGCQFLSDEIQPLSRDPIAPTTPEADSEADVQNLLKNKADVVGRALGCEGDGYETQYWKIARLFDIPEFRLEFKPFDVDIGCGVIITLIKPVLSIRMSELDLDAYVRRPHLDVLVMNAMVDCLFEAALAGAVVGVVLANPAAASAAFSAQLNACIERRLTDVIECLVPGITLVNRVREEWHTL